MLDRGVRAVIQKKGINHLFESVGSHLKTADQVIANFECAACDSSYPAVPKTFNFKVNPNWLPELKQNGITHLNLANNHTYDFGQECFSETVANIRKTGMVPVGLKNESDFYEPTLIQHQGNTIALFSVTRVKSVYSTSVYRDSLPELLSRIKQFKSRYPVSIILVNLHWGIELKDKPEPFQVNEAHLLVNAGVDLVIGHHPHTVQTIEMYKGKYIFYSIGNFIFDAIQPATNKGILVSVSASENRLKNIAIIPYNIVSSKPVLMSKEEAETYLKSPNLFSPKINPRMKNGAWEIL